MPSASHPDTQPSILSLHPPYIAPHRPIHSLYSCTHFIYNPTHSFDYHTYSPHSPTHSLHSQTPYIHSLCTSMHSHMGTHMYPYVLESQTTRRHVDIKSTFGSQTSRRIASEPIFETSTYFLGYFPVNLKVTFIYFLIMFILYVEFQKKSAVKLIYC